MRLVDSLEEQAVLEGVLEENKPPLPEAMRGLHYLLVTPFRYRPPTGSRFRAPYEPGVWYGAEALRTALAEKSYWRLRFLLDAPDVPDLKPVPHTAFQARVRTARALDLTREPLVRERARWTAPSDYGPTQALAGGAREAGLEALRYESVRDPGHEACVAVLDPRVFGHRAPQGLATWFIAAGRARVRCLPERGEGPGWDFEATQLLVAVHT